MTTDTGVRLDVFVKGLNSTLYHAYIDKGQAKLSNFDNIGGSKIHWTPWEKLGGICVGQPRAVIREGKTLDIFVKQSDSKLYRKFFDGSSWQPSSGFEDLGIYPIGNTVT